MPEQDKYPYDPTQTKGVVFKNGRKTKETQPDLLGTISLSRDLLKELVEKAKAGEEPKISVSIWEAQSRAGQPYWSVKGQLWKEYVRPDAPSRRNNDVPW